jgi:osmotically-inducible protein OsmY
MNALEQKVKQALAAHRRAGTNTAAIVPADEVAERITDTIGVNAIVGADQITVTVRGDVVTLTGTVRSPGDRDLAVEAASATPGVRDVRDEIEIAS